MLLALVAIGIAALPLLGLTWWLERPMPEEPVCRPGCGCRGDVGRQRP